MEQDHYAVLGVVRTADQAAIRTAYRALMRLYHPDADSSAEAAEQARAINQAYAVLGDPEKRARYDGSLESKRPLRFEPAGEVSIEAKEIRIAPFLAAGVALLAAGMVAFAIMPQTQPVGLVPGPLPNARPPKIEAAAAEHFANASQKPVASTLVAPKETLTEPEPVELAEITPEPAAKSARSPALAKRMVEPDPSVATPAKPSAQPASSNSSCPSPARRADRLMCGDRNLASLDRQLALLYRQSYSQADEAKRAALVGTRQRFNDRRDTCETSNCLTTAYVVRLKEISDIMAGRVQP